MLLALCLWQLRSRKVFAVSSKHKNILIPTSATVLAVLVFFSSVLQSSVLRVGENRSGRSTATFFNRYEVLLSVLFMQRMWYFPFVLLSLNAPVKSNFEACAAVGWNMEKMKIASYIDFFFEHNMKYMIYFLLSLFCKKA